MTRQEFTKITETHNFIEVAEAINKADQDTLVLFDVDDVLIMDQNEYRLTHPYRNEWFIESKKRLLKNERDLLISIILKERDVRLVDPYITDILNDLEKRKIKTLALTKLYTGKYGVIEDLTDWRIKELKSINIDFMKLAPIKDEILVDELQIGCGIPMIKEGVILTADVDKGVVLENILHKKQYYPKSIIFVDDILENLESLQKICLKLKINFHGFEFKGALTIPEPTLDKQSEKIRFEILEKEYRWLTDKKLVPHN